MIDTTKVPFPTAEELTEALCSEDLFDAVVQLLLRHVVARVLPERLSAGPQADDPVVTQRVARQVVAVFCRGTQRYGESTRVFLSYRIDHAGVGLAVRSPRSV